MTWWQKFIEAIKRIFFDGEVYDPSKEPQEITSIPPGVLSVTKRKISAIPKVGDIGSDVKIVQQALIERGYKLKDDGIYGTQETVPAVSKFQKTLKLPGSGVLGPQTVAALGIEVDSATKQEPVIIKNPVTGDWLAEAEKYNGMKETDKKLQDKVVPYWKKVGLGGYKTIVGTSFAWCGVFVYMVLFDAGIKPLQNGAAGAVNWMKYGQKIEWHTNGIPRKAILQLNHGGQSDCGDSGSNHVTLSFGSCEAKDLIDMVKNSKGEYVPVLKKGVSIWAFGGNQGNTAKPSKYDIKEICAVRWPRETLIGDLIALPPPVTKSENCPAIGNAPKESTR